MQAVRELLSDPEWSTFTIWCADRPVQHVDHAVGYVLGYGRLPQDLSRLLPQDHSERLSDDAYFRRIRA